MPDLVRARALAQLLDRPAGTDAVDVTRHLLAVQAQELISARRAIRARSRGATAGGIDRLLSEDRALVITWLNRGTLHLVDRDDYPWLLGLTAARSVTGNARRLAQEGVSPADAERAVAAVVGALTEHGPLTRDALRDHIAGAGVPVNGQAVVHVLMRSGLLGLTVRGPVKQGTRAVQAYALTRDWLACEPPPTSLTGDARDRALAELARRYLRGHGPACEQDMATWAGLPLRDVRAGLAAIARELVELPGGLVDLAARRTTGRLAPRLLPSFDPALVGWRRRDHVVAREHQAVHVTRGGVIPAVAVDAGRALGTWWARRDRDRLRVTVEPFPGIVLDQRLERAFARDAADLERFERT